jgi:hypothetical protein
MIAALVDAGLVIAGAAVGVVCTLLYLGEETRQRGFMPAGICVALVLICAAAAALE